MHRGKFIVLFDAHVLIGKITFLCIMGNCATLISYGDSPHLAGHFWKHGTNTVLPARTYILDTLEIKAKYTRYHFAK